MKKFPRQKLQLLFLGGMCCCRDLAFQELRATGDLRTGYKKHDDRVSGSDDSVFTGKVKAQSNPVIFSFDLFFGARQLVIGCFDHPISQCDP